MKYAVAVASGLVLTAFLSLSVKPALSVDAETRQLADAWRSVERCHPGGVNNIIHCVCKMCGIGCTCGCEEFPCTGECGRGLNPHCQCMICVDYASQR